jgi:hypothetical protein
MMINKGTIAAIVTMTVMIAGISTIIPGTTTAIAQSGCSEPQVYKEDDRFLVQYCSDGINMIDTKNGSEAFITDDRICEEVGICIQPSS